MNFEEDGDGIAFKFRKRNDKMLLKTGDREHSIAHVYDIPDNQELIAFHGKEDANKNIIELGIITRDIVCPGPIDE